MICDLHRQTRGRTTRGSLLDDEILPAWKDETQFVRIIFDDLAFARIRIVRAVVIFRAEINPALRNVATGRDELHMTGCGQQREHATTGRCEINRDAILPCAEILFVPEVEDVDGHACGQAQVLPTDVGRSGPTLIEIEQADDIVIATQMIDLQIPEALVARGREQV